MTPTPSLHTRVIWGSCEYFCVARLLSCTPIIRDTAIANTLKWVRTFILRSDSISWMRVLDLTQDIWNPLPLSYWLLWCPSLLTGIWGNSQSDLYPAPPNRTLWVPLLTFGLLPLCFEDLHRPPADVHCLPQVTMDRGHFPSTKLHSQGVKGHIGREKRGQLRLQNGNQLVLVIWREVEELWTT